MRQTVRIQSRLPGENLPWEIIPAQTILLTAQHAKIISGMTSSIIKLGYLVPNTETYVALFMKLSRQQYVSESKLAVDHAQGELKKIRRDQYE
jgi:hypothetical protein